MAEFPIIPQKAEQQAVAKIGISHVPAVSSNSNKCKALWDKVATEFHKELHRIRTEQEVTSSHQITATPPIAKK
jgi:hypothetical protein